MASFLISQDFSQESLDGALGGENPLGERRSDGRQFPNGRLSFPIRLPFVRFKSARLSFEATFKSEGAHSLDTSGLALAFGGNQSVESAIAEEGGGRVARLSEGLRPGWRQRFDYLIAPGRATLEVDGKPFISWSDRRIPGGFCGLTLRIWGDPLIHTMSVEVEPHEPAPSASAREAFQFQVTVDFVDDLMPGVPFGKGHFDSMLDHFESWGVRRIDYIYYDYSPGGGFWEDAGSSLDRVAKGYAAAVKGTFERVGNPLDYLIKQGHARGMEVYGLLKPYEMGYSFLEVYPFNSSEAAKHGRVKLVDGWSPILAKALRERTDMLIQRRAGASADDLRERKIRSIKLYHVNNEPTGLDPKAIRIWVSRDNQSYAPYTGPCRITERSEARQRPQYDCRGVTMSGPVERVQVIAIEGIDIDAPFVALTVSAGGRARLINRLYALAELLDDRGERISFSYGLEANPLSNFTFEDGQPFTGPLNSTDLAHVSLRYDDLNSTLVMSLNAGADGIEDYFTFGFDRKLMAFAKGKNPCLAGAPEAAYPEVRGIWMDSVRDMLRRGVDGIDFRVQNHNHTLEWRQYGYNEPVVEEFKRRYGVDIRSAEFDIAAWRRLRGEYYTEFLREASAAIHAAKRKCRMHLSPCQGEPAEGRMTLMNTHWDWRAWIERGYVDEISNKGGVYEGTFWDEVRALAGPRGIPIYMVPSCGPVGFGSWGWREEHRRMFDYARATGHSGFNLYECCSLLRPKAGVEALELLPRGEGFTEFMREYRAGMA